MGEKYTNDDMMNLEEDFASLVRVASKESVEDVRLLLAKFVRKYRTHRPEFAERINAALRSTQTRSTGASILRRGLQQSAISQEMPLDTDTGMSLIRVFDDLAGLDAPLLPENLLKQVQSIVRERKERVKLAAHGVSPTRSAILVGPPGVGKTLSARWIAYQIGKPLWVLDLTTVMSSLLGKTGNNLRKVFDHARASEAILLLDEIDAIAKRRSDESDVGELKRLVTAILQEVYAWPDTGLLLAATNHPELIDPALWRRFDAILTFENSDQAMIVLAIRRFLGIDVKTFEPVISLLAASLKGSSLSDVERAVKTLRRNAVLENIDPSELAADMAAQYAEKLDKTERLELALELARTKSLSHNRIMSLTGVSRDTIRKYTGPSPIKGRGGKKEI